MATDLELLRAWNGGDARAGHELFQRHFDSLCRFFRNKCGDAEDLIQRTLLSCMEAADRIDERGSFRAYLFRVARNELFSYYRRQRPDVTNLDSAAVATLGASPSQLLADRREQRLLLHALRELPLDFQIAIELYYWEDLSGPELSRALGVPETTVRGRLRRGRELLVERIRELSDTPAFESTTIDNLDAWARRVAECVTDHRDD